MQKVEVRGSHISQEIRFISAFKNYPVPNSIYQTFLPHLSQLPGFLVATFKITYPMKVSEKFLKKSNK